MSNFQTSGLRVALTSVAFAIAALGLEAAAEHKDLATNPSAEPTKKAEPATQKDRDFEHEMVQSDGVNHPREIVGAPKKAVGMKKALPATQKDKDFEHEMVQSDGVNHPREIVGAQKKRVGMKKAAPATQKDKDFEHELVQSDGVVHPREVVKK